MNQISIWSYKGIIRLHGFRLKVCSHDRFGKSVTCSTRTHGKYLPMLETPRPFMKEQGPPRPPPMASGEQCVLLESGVFWALKTP